MRKAIGYPRVSTNRQAEKGLSLEEQCERIQAWCAKHDLEPEFVEDRRTGRHADKRKVAAAVQRACDLKAPFVVYEINRFARNVEDACRMARQLRDAGADLVLLKEQLDTKTAAGRLQFHMMASMAEWFSDQLSERMGDSIAYRKEHDLIYGPVPFGQKRGQGKALVEDPREKSVLRLICELRIDGLSYQEIADELERRSIPTKKGKTKWSKSLIRTFVERARHGKREMRTA